MTSHVTASVFDVVEEPINSVVHTQPVRQVSQTGLTSSEEQDEQVMETEELVPTQSQTSENITVRSFTPPPDSIPSDTHSHSTEQTDSQPQSSLEETNTRHITSSVTSDEGRENTGEREGKGDGEREKSEGCLLTEGPSHSQTEVRSEVGVTTSVF